MDVQRFADANLFLAAASPFARKSAALDAFLHAWVHGVSKARVIGHCYMAVACPGGGFALQRDDGPVFLGGCTQAAAGAFADDVFARFPAADAVTGSEEACAAFAARWTTHTGRIAKLRLRTRNHALTRLVAPPANDGRLRAAASTDRDWLIASLAAFSDEARIRIGPATIVRAVDERIDEGTWRLWCVDDVRVAFAGTTEAGPRGSRIGPVYTLPAWRRRGHGSALVAAVCDELLRARPNVFLTTDVDNPTSNALYRRLGFEPIEDFVLCDLVEPA